jgi:hypothetical protein
VVASPVGRLEPVGPSHFSGTRRIVRLALLRSPRRAPLVGASRYKVWPSRSVGHRDSRSLLLRLPGGRLLRLLYRTATTTAVKIRRLGLVD